MILQITALYYCSKILEFNSWSDIKVECQVKMFVCHLTIDQPLNVRGIQLSVLPKDTF